MLLAVFPVLLVALSPRPGNCATAQPSLQRVFHLVGIAGVRRNERVNVTFTSDSLQFQTKQVHYSIPYARIQQVLLLRADRRYEGRTYALAVATYGLGGLLILKKHHVDTAVIDYVNERQGKMGIVLQMELAQGEQFWNLLKGQNVNVIEPDAAPDTPTQKQNSSNQKDR